MPDEYDAALFDSQWRDLFLAGDPYFHPRLSKGHDDFSSDYEPDRVLVAGRPLLPRQAIQKILVVKLDHIGDCIMAFTAVRRLKQHFPTARITVLTSRASQSVWALEPSVAATIEFDFFHARSALGELKLSDEDWQKLTERLLPEQFDLAVDLRKHPETRSVLQHTGARYVAGFDHRNLFPWLDVALDWGGDQTLVRKRQHVADDLVNLCDAIAAACEDERASIPRPAGRLPASLTRRLERFAGRPLVCVHPIAGTETRQWPPSYFAAVIDRLIQEEGARVVLIGGPGDTAVTEELIGQLRRPEGVVSLIGEVPLDQLPGLLAAASLFLGNNSGPHHIAAGLGVPTVGVHSGTVDAQEWGPIGPAAVAITRDVMCAPCYLANPADCRRGLACLRQLSPEVVYNTCRRLLLLSAPAPAATKGATVKPSRPEKRVVRGARQSAAALAAVSPR